MKRVMLILFDFSDLEQVIYTAFKATDKDGKLEVIAIVNDEVPSSLSDIISQVGFLGEKVTSDVENAIVNEYKTRAKKELNQIAVQGEEKDCTVDVDLVTRNSLEGFKEEIDAEKFDCLVINYTKDGFISNDVLSYDLDSFLEGIKIPYKVYYDGEIGEEKEGL